MISALIVSLTLARVPEVSRPVPEPSLLQMSPDAARRILERLDEQDRRTKALERLRDDLRGWPHDVGFSVAGFAFDAISTGVFRDQPSRNLVEANPLIGNGPGAAERHVGLKAIGAVAVGAICYELRRAGHPKEARILSLFVGGGFFTLGVVNFAR